MTGKKCSAKELNELQRLNAVVNSIDRVIKFGLQTILQTTTDDLKRLREKINRRRQELITMPATKE